MIDVKTARAVGRLTRFTARNAAPDMPADGVIGITPLLPVWRPDNYLDRVGEAYVFGGYPYRVFQPHDSTQNPGWTPEAYPAGWTPYHGTTPETALPYRQPTGAHDIYKAGEMMVWTDCGLWRCLADTNFSPETYPQAWGEVTV